MYTKMWGKVPIRPYWKIQSFLKNDDPTSKINKTKVKSVQLGKTLSFVKFLDCSSLTEKMPTYQILDSCYAQNPSKSFRWVVVVVVGGGLESEFSVHLWSEASA